MAATLTEVGSPRVILRTRPGLDLSDDQFFALCALNRDLRLEQTAEGDIIVMPPADSEIGYRNAIVTSRLTAWALDDGTGLPFDSSAGFKLPNGATRSPDASWASRERVAAIPKEQRKGFWSLCPEFVVEIRSPSDRLTDVKDKLREYLDNGARLGWLIDPIERKVHVYRPDQPPEVLDAPTELTADPVPPGFVLDRREVWDPPIDDDGGDDGEDRGGTQP